MNEAWIARVQCAVQVVERRVHIPAFAVKYSELDGGDAISGGREVDQAPGNDRGPSPCRVDALDFLDQTGGSAGVPRVTQGLCHVAIGVSLLPVSGGKVLAREQMMRVKFESPGRPLDRLVITALVPVGQRDLQMDERGGRFAFERLLLHAKTFVKAPLSFEQAAENQVCLCVVGIQVDGAAQAPLGGHPVPFAEKQNDAKRDLGVGTGKVQCECRQCRGFGVLIGVAMRYHPELGLRTPRESQPGVCRGVGRIDGEGGLERLYRLGRFGSRCRQQMGASPSIIFLQFGVHRGCALWDTKRGEAIARTRYGFDETPAQQPAQLRNMDWQNALLHK